MFTLLYQARCYKALTQKIYLCESRMNQVCWSLCEQLTWKSFAKTSFFGQFCVFTYKCVIIWVIYLISIDLLHLFHDQAFCRSLNVALFINLVASSNFIHLTSGHNPPWQLICQCEGRQLLANTSFPISPCPSLLLPLSSPTFPTSLLTNSWRLNCSLSAFLRPRSFTTSALFRSRPAHIHH